MKMLIFLILLSLFSCNSSESQDESDENVNLSYKSPKTMTQNAETTLNISSIAFKNGEKIPAKFTCDGEKINPPLHIKGFSPATQTFALILEDPDAPNGSFIHWLCWNLPPVEDISENSKSGIQAENSAGKKGYYGPCPPAGKPHHYIFRIFALDKKLDLPESASRQELEKAMEGHILAKGELMGIYSSD